MESKTDELAIISFIFSILGIFSFGFLSIVGMILGFIANSRISKYGYKGAGYSNTAIVIGVISCIIYFLIYYSSI